MITLWIAPNTPRSEQTGNPKYKNVKLIKGLLGWNQTKPEQTEKEAAHLEKKWSKNQTEKGRR